MDELQRLKRLAAELGFGDSFQIATPYATIEAGINAVRIPEDAADPEPDPVPGIPLITEVRLPLKDLSQHWYEAAHRFGPYNGHPRFAEDWNYEAGGNSDLGAGIVAPFHGLVINAFDAGGAWGPIVRILGRLVDGTVITWMGAHLQETYVTTGQIVQAGDDVGTIGNVNGRYSAHLHEQIAVGEVPGPEVFGTDRRYDFRQPSAWYKAHGVDKDLIERVTAYDGN
jgi:hypothetical protein